MNNKERGVEYERIIKKKLVIIGMVNFFGCGKEKKPPLEWNGMSFGIKPCGPHMTRPTMV
jgi:hypothetical protein